MHEALIFKIKLIHLQLTVSKQYFSSLQEVLNRRKIKIILHTHINIYKHICIYELQNINLLLF